MSAISLADFDTICRSCLCKTGEMRPIFGSSLDDMLRDVTDIQAIGGDGMPGMMCVPCVLQVSRAYTFRQKCRRSDETLQSLLAQSKLITEKEVRFCEPSDASLMLATDLLSVTIEQGQNLSDEMRSMDSHRVGSENDKLAAFDELSVKDEPIEVSFTDIHSHAEKFDERAAAVEPSILNALAAEMKTPGFHITDITDTAYECSMCPDTFSSDDELQAHVKSVHAMTVISSNQHSDYAEQSTNDINENVTRQKFECPECHKCFGENKILKRHLKIHSPVKPHVCNVCGMSFAESSNLSKHMKKHTGELRNVIGKPNLCSVCGKGFKWASSLSKHMKHHTRRKILNCPYCPKYYVEARSLNIHLRSHTGEKPFVCSTCKKGFTQMGNLEKHLRVHTGEKPYSCPVCQKGFSQSGYVAIHLRTHTGEKPYICEDCGKAFAGSNTLAIHKRTHTGERPYPCGVCDKTFARLETAIIHQRTHTGERPFSCTLCSRGFTSSGHLAGHMRSHNGIKTHECKVCQKRFAGSSSLKVHMRTHVDKSTQPQKQQQQQQQQQQQLLQPQEPNVLQQPFDDKDAIFQCDMCKMNIPSTLLTAPDELQAYNHEVIDDVLICSNIASIIDNDKIIEQMESGQSIVLTGPGDSDAEQQLLLNLSDLK